jgi:hypothetical protein
MRIVPTLHGWLWIRDAARIFARKPILWMLLVMLYWLALSIMGAVPALGIIVGLMVIPAFSASFMIAARDIEQGRVPGPRVLASGFQRNRRAMLTLGGIYFVGCALVLGITSFFDEGALLAALRGARPTAEIQRSVAIASLCYAPVMLAFWFAPALTAWQDQSAGKALFFSFVAASRNWRAMLFYGLMLAALAVIVAVIMVFAVRLFGAAAPEAAAAKPDARLGLLGIVMTPVILAASAILFASWYVSYRDVFPVNDEPVAPPAPPPT